MIDGSPSAALYILQLFPSAANHSLVGIGGEAKLYGAGMLRFHRRRKYPTLLERVSILIGSLSLESGIGTRMRLPWYRARTAAGTWHLTTRTQANGPINHPLAICCPIPVVAAEVPAAVPGSYGLEGHAPCFLHSRKVPRYADSYNRSALLTHLNVRPRRLFDVLPRSSLSPDQQSQHIGLDHHVNFVLPLARFRVQLLIVENIAHHHSSLVNRLDGA
mmetsp:Transcript_23381/g.54366  ORF Transcript_23381/g.54366 Transcript_23381/m.54366 type:complete len:218 (+) Transcript_23381:657-1310(+)